MANDDPTSMHMLFGYQQSRAVGVTRFRQPRAASTNNFLMKERAATRKIADLTKNNPSMRRWALKVRPLVYNAQNLLAVLTSDPETLPRHLRPPQSK
jgi:hypothetical protein